MSEEASMEDLTAQPIYHWVGELHATMRSGSGPKFDLELEAHLYKTTAAGGACLCGLDRTYGFNLYPVENYTFRGEPIKRCEKCQAYAAREGVNV